jgi:hypothetical protein
MGDCFASLAMTYGVVLSSDFAFVLKHSSSGLDARLIIHYDDSEFGSSKFYRYGGIGSL